MSDSTWWRTRWMEAVWSSDLKPLQRLVAAVYADHARDQRTSWVTLARLMERSGLSRDAANRAVRELRDLGWLVVMTKASQHRATVYGLVIPESSSTPGVPLSSTGDVPLTTGSSTPPDTSSTPPDTSSTPGVPNQSSIKEHHHSSSSPARTMTARLLGWPEEDDRLDHVEDFLSAKNVGKALPWLRACHESGDLERIYLAFVEEQSEPTTPARPEPEHEPTEWLWSRIKEETGYMDIAEQLVAAEAEAMGDPRRRDPVVLKSVLMTLAHEKRKTA